MKVIITADEFLGLHGFLGSVAKLIEPFRKDWAKRLRQESTLARVQELFCSLVAQGIDTETALSMTEKFFLEGQAVFEFFRSGKDLVIEPIGGFRTSLMLIEIASKEEKQGKTPSVIKLKEIAEKLKLSPSQEKIIQGKIMLREGTCCQ